MCLAKCSECEKMFEIPPSKISKVVETHSKVVCPSCDLKIFEFQLEVKLATARAGEK